MSTSDNTATEKRDVYRTVTDAIIEAIERGVGSWRMPWNTSGRDAFSPINVTSKRPYRGINTLCLWSAAQAKGFESGEWGTYQQWHERKAQVRKGEKSTLVVFWKFANGADDTDDADDSIPKAESRLLFTRGYSVFNAAQVDGYTLKAETEPVPPQLPQPVQPHDPAVQRSMVGGFWRTDGNYKSALYLTNGLVNAPLSVTPILYLSNGVQYILPDVHLEPAGTAIVDINAGLQQHGVAPWATLSGYVEVRYKWAWDALCVTVRNADTIHSELFNFNLRPSTRAGAQTPVSPMEGLWWKQEPNVTGFIALTNLSSNSLNATVQVSDETNTPLGKHTITVAPHGTKLVNMSELQSASSVMGGIRIAFDGVEDDWIVNGGLEDQATGYSANIPFTVALPPSVAQKTSHGYAELGLMVGSASPMMSFPFGTVFVPYSMVRNVSDQPVLVTPTLWWMNGASAQSAKLTPVTVPPFQSFHFDIPSLLAGAGLQNYNGSLNLIVDVDGPRRSVLLASGSVDQKNTYVFQVSPTAVSESVGKSLSYWSTGNGDDTMVTLWNPADETQDLLFTLVFSSGRYAYPVHLEARATRGFDISEIIRNQIPDAQGNTIPASIHEGSAELSGTRGVAERILITMDAGTYNVQKAMCGIYCASCHGISSYWASGNTSTAVGFSTQLTLNAMYDINTPVDLTGSVYWSSSNTNVATVSNGSVTGVSAGSVTITGEDDTILLRNFSSCSSYPIDCNDYAGVVQTVAFQSNCAIPTNYRETTHSCNSITGALSFTYTWDSSTGQKSDLAACTVREVVVYQNGPSPDSPPFPSYSFTNPTILGGPGNSASASDTHYVPTGSFVKPYSENTFHATQKYEYNCPCQNTSDYTSFSGFGMIDIARQVTNPSGTWLYMITKSGQSCSFSLSPQ